MQRGERAIPLLSLVGLAIFLGIFFTNTLPAKKKLAQRRQVLLNFETDGGTLDQLRGELRSQEDLLHAIEGGDDPEVVWSYWLDSFPTAPENDPENLLIPMAISDLPLASGPVDSARAAPPLASPSSDSGLARPAPASHASPTPVRPRHRARPPRPRSSPSRGAFQVPPFLLR